MHDVGFEGIDDPTECKRFFEQPHTPAFIRECCNLPHTGQCGEFPDAFSFGTAQHNGRFILLRWQPIQRLEQLRFGTVLCHGINDIQNFNFTLRDFNFTLRVGEGVRNMNLPSRRSALRYAYGLPVWSQLTDK